MRRIDAWNTNNMETVLDMINGSQNYPPVNVIEWSYDGDTEYELQFAVAGFRKDELEVKVTHRELVVTGNISRPEQGKTKRYMHKGISERSFRRVFTLGKGVQVVGSRLKDGILSIDLKRETPPSDVITIK